MVDEETGFDDQDEKFTIIKQPRTAIDYEIHLTESIENNYAYVELLHTLRNCSENDTVTLYLANFGGQCGSGFQIVNAIKDCRPGVDVVVDAPCYSMGAILALSGRSLTMNPGTFLMFHNYSGGHTGKGKETVDAIKHYYDHFHRHLKTVCSPFLTAKELTDLKNDKDIYIGCDDESMAARIKRHYK